MKLPADHQLAKSLRQAALRLDQIQRDEKYKRPTGDPSDHITTIWDWAPLIRKATTVAQLKAVIDALDICFNEDDRIMQGEDWPFISKLINDVKSRIESAPLGTKDAPNI